jgi:putative permease
MLMLKVLSDWSRRTFSDPEVSILLLTLLFIAGVLFFVGGILAPVFASIVLAYVLEGFVNSLSRLRCPRPLALGLVFLSAMGFFLAALLWFFPLIWREASAFVQALPVITSHGQTWMADLPYRYPELISPSQMEQLTEMAHSEMGQFGKQVLAFTLGVIPNLLELVIYLVLVPFLVFFFLKDGYLIFTWLSDYFPQRRRLVRQVWHEVDGQLGRYIRGKLVEIVLVSVVSSLTFAFWGLNYAVLLGCLVGVSTLVPYVGAVVVSIPVVLLIMVQWGMSHQAIYLLIAYGVIHLLDGQVLVPLLFSEALKLHPIAIFLSIMLFGGLWGFWGVFFAIPLATLVKAVLNAWPKMAG